jgi:hypothetical protein
MRGRQAGRAEEMIAFAGVGKRVVICGGPTIVEVRGRREERGEHLHLEVVVHVSHRDDCSEELDRSW